MGNERQTCRILQLSDCTMMYILSYLDATSLFNLSRTCSYFKNIAEDPQLWKYIEARREPNSTKKVQYVCERVYDKTAHLFLKAESKYNGLAPQSFLLSLNCLEHLTILALENQRLDGRTLTLSDFPKTLDELSLKKTHVKNGKLFFQGSFHTMRNLRVLILDECDWVDSNFFMSIAKYDKLEILSIIKCMRLHLNVIPYLSVARHGCKQLKIIDCRFNTVGNEILRTFDSHHPLLALYFQSMRSYQFDKGTPFMKCPPLLHEYQDLISQSTIKNRSLEQYKYIIGDLIEELPQSVLYKDPYPDCTCKYKDGINEELLLLSNDPCNLMTQPRPMPVDDFIDFHLSPQRFICRRHHKELNKLPKDFKNFFYQNQKKFYPDSSDNDSDSDDDRDCCMFGVGKSQQMIVLKVREVDEQGNLPEPEVINLAQPERNVINIDVDVNRGRVMQRRADFDRCYAQPSTSRQLPPAAGSSQPARGAVKRKAEEDGRANDRKKAKLDQAGGRGSRTHSTSESDASKSESETNCRDKDVSDGDDNDVMDSSSSDSSPRKGPAAAGPSPRPNNVGEAGPSEASARAQALPAVRIEPPRREDYIRVVQVPLYGAAQDEADNPTKKIKLRRLALRGYTEITDDALFSLRNLSLDLLDVTYTGVSKEGVEKFLTLNPDCRVIHKDYCVCKPRTPC